MVINAKLVKCIEDYSTRYIIKHKRSVLIHELLESGACGEGITYYQLQKHIKFMQEIGIFEVPTSDKGGSCIPVKVKVVLGE